jgi:hypothetical protein
MSNFAFGTIIDYFLAIFVARYTMKKPHPILTVQISDLDMSREFKAMAAKNNFGTLMDIVSLSKSSKQLIELPGMGYRQLSEFYSLLDRFGLLYLAGG